MEILIFCPKNINWHKLSERKNGDIYQQLCKRMNTCFIISHLETYAKGMM